MPVAIINTTGSALVVPAQAGSIIRVHQYVIVADTDVRVTWQSMTPAGVKTSISGPMQMGPTNGAAGISTGEADGGMLFTAAGEGLYLLLSGAVRVGGTVKWSYA